ncbi:MAG: ion channel [Novosphingobium sp.]|nr:two pore domain potassium channel family protein [Novosphingobium sp.]
MEYHLFTVFVASTIMLVLSVAIHGLGLFSLNRALRTEANEERIRRMTALSFRGAVFTLGMVLALFAVHGIEIWAYAFLYLAVGAAPNLHDALYFSTISYTTVGYNDDFIAEPWRLIGAFESIVGLILIGWSTAFFFRMLGRIDAH